jgi:8-oxo-dGTP pyrophosphatase MutT (NUDIX family)
MYKVFFNQKPLILTTTPPMNTPEVLVLPIKYTTAQHIVSAAKSKLFKEVYIYHPKEEKLWKHFYARFPLVEAAGGYVRHENGKNLMIFRNGKWDLPKGRIEKKEMIIDAAVREVREETGVSDLIVSKPLDVTLHLFKRNGKYRLKKTFWYFMLSKCTNVLNPQLNEGIEKAVWVTDEELKENLKNAYENIKVHFDVAS